MDSLLFYGPFMLYTNINDILRLCLHDNVFGPNPFRFVYVYCLRLHGNNENANGNDEQNKSFSKHYVSRLRVNIENVISHDVLNMEAKQRVMVVMALLNLLSTLISLHQLNCLLMYITASSYYQMKKKICHVALLGRNPGKVYKRKRSPRSWIRPGRTQVWWENFVNDVVVSQKWKENYMVKKTF